MVQKIGDGGGDAAALARAFERMGGTPGRATEPLQREAPAESSKEPAAEEDSDDEDRVCALLDALDLVDGWEVPPMPPLPSPASEASGAPAGIRGLGVAGVAATSRAPRASE